jgi:ankyrin repeat protein
MHEAVVCHPDELIDLFYQYGADVNAASHQGETPLMTACFLGQARHVEKLLSLGADPNRQDNSGDTALHFLSNCSGGFTSEAELIASCAKILALLASSGARFETCNAEGLTAIEKANYCELLTALYSKFGA